MAYSILAGTTYKPIAPGDPARTPNGLMPCAEEPSAIKSSGDIRSFWHLGDTPVRIGVCPGNATWIAKYPVA